MKIQIVLLAVIGFCSVLGYSQKHDYNWVSGNSIEKPSNSFSLYNLNFSDDSLKLIALSEADSTKIWMSNYYTTSYSDKEGLLKFITNGLRIYDASFETMLNGDSLNPGRTWNLSNNAKHGYQSSRGICALPGPENNQKYTYLVHQGKDTSETWLTYLFANPLYITKINMEGNNGLGEVIEKNIIVDTGHFEPLTAVKHANGRDWWIIMPEMFFNKYHTLLLTPEGLKGPWIQEIGPNFTIDQGSFMVSEFSPTGNKFIRGWLSEDKIVVFDFDRCSGLLSSPKQFLYPDTLNIIRSLFSPAGKYLYLSSYYKGKLYQLDLEASNLSLIEIADFNNTLCQDKSNKPGYLANGPDGKIYITGGEIKYCISVIHEPDKAYPNCDIQFSKIEIPYSNISFPYFPNYRLGALPGSPCDTITTTNNLIKLDKFELKIFPNPSSSLVNVEITLPYYNSKELAVLEVYDVSGKIVHSHTYPPFAYIHSFDLKNFASGNYITSLKFKNKIVVTSKLTVEH